MADRLSSLGSTFEKASRLFETRMLNLKVAEDRDRYVEEFIPPAIAKMKSERLEIEEEFRTLIGVK